MNHTHYLKPGGYVAFDPSLTWPEIGAASAPPEAPPKPLAAQAARLYPHSEALQREWMRAVTVVRRTRRGWLLDHPVARRPL